MLAHFSIASQFIKIMSQCQILISAVAWFLFKRNKSQLKCTSCTRLGRLDRVDGHLNECNLRALKLLHDDSEASSLLHREQDGGEDGRWTDVMQRFVHAKAVDSSVAPDYMSSASKV